MMRTIFACIVRGHNDANGKFMMSPCDNYVNRSEVCSDALQQLCTNSLDQNSIISMHAMNVFNC